MSEPKSALTEIPKQYEPSKIEDKWYAYWLENRFFHSEPDDREPFTIVIPPPNVTGVLHMGHMLNNTIQDVLIRKARMQGKNACWVPGTDHASIATEAKVVRKLREQGIKKSDLTREEFTEKAWKWTEEHGGLILQQLRKLGASCDWDRTRFTLEDDLYDAVIDCFIDLYERGFIYRGLRMIHWDPEAKTALSDEEVIHREVKSKLYHVRYRIKNANDNEFVTIATTRPETILADTGICVHPDDERYQHLIGKYVIIPLVEREVPVIADDYVDPKFGTGCLKVTPAHDINDYEIGQRHGLEVIDMFHEDGTVSPAGKFFIGQDRFDARKSILKELKLQDLLVDTEEIDNKLGYSERTDAVIEPRLSFQWFCRMEDLAKPALENVLNDEIKFHPSKFKNTYKYWMENIRDWCISRQLWWGQRIPAWYYGSGHNDYVIAKTSSEAIEKARIKSENSRLSENDLHQDEDVLDTWFSSWLWPITVFDGFKDPDNKEINYYYPTNDLVTAPEIMFFWVARMIMAGYTFREEKPFKNVYYHGIVRDSKRQKMSKSLGNSPDPLNLINEFGADGTRVGMLFSSPAGNDLLFDQALCEQGRNFSNKIWNAYRFLSMNMEQGRKYNPTLEIDEENLADRWMLSRLHETIGEVAADFDRFEINKALLKVYSLVWDDFCDWYIEMIKANEQGARIPGDRLERALGFFEVLMKLLHPFMPFITEEIWHQIRDRNVDEAIIVSPWPEFDNKYIDAESQKLFRTVQQMVSAIRNIQAEMGLSPKTPLRIYIKPNHPDLTSKFTSSGWIFYKLLSVESITVDTEITKPPASASVVVEDSEIYIPLEGLIDLDKERHRMKKEIENTLGFLKSVEKKLSNDQFINNAPAAVVENERAKKADADSKLLKLNQLLNDLG